MRKGIKLFLICCAAAGCAKVGTETDTQPKQFTMIVEAESPATKTFVHDNGDNTYAVNWSEGDQIAVWETAGGETVEVPSTPLLAETGTALFSVTLDEKVASSYKYFAAFPASRASKIGKNVQLVLPKDQMFKTTTFDKTADILISGVKELNSQPSMLGMNFARVGATAKLVITGIGSGETVDKIVFSTTEHEIAGTVSASIATGALQPGGSDGYNSITLQPATTLLTDGGEVVVWFRLLAGDLTDNLSVRVEMDKAVYDKTVDLATAGKTIAFADGALTKFKVNVGATREGRYSYSFRSDRRRALFDGFFFL